MRAKWVSVTHDAWQFEVRLSAIAVFQCLLQMGQCDANADFNFDAMKSNAQERIIKWFEHIADNHFKGVFFGHTQKRQCVVCHANIATWINDS